MGQTKEIYLVIRGQRWTNQWKILAFYNRRKAMKYAWKKAKKSWKSISTEGNISKKQKNSWRQKASFSMKKSTFR